MKIETIELTKHTVRVGGSLPDIDNDVQGSRRDEVKRYIEERYGVDYVAGIGTYGTFKIRAALKDLVREIGGDGKEANYISAAIDENDKVFDLIKKSIEKSANPRLKSFVMKHAYQINHIDYIFQQPKTQSIHAAGIIIVPKDNGPIYQQLPVKVMDGIVITEWEGTQIEEAGFLKVDVLGLKQLDKFDEIIALIKQNRGDEIILNDIPLDEEGVYDFFRKGFNEDVFQFGGGGLKGYCKTLKPDNIEDLIATVALYRPGPIEIGAHERYAQIKNGEMEPQYYFGLQEITEKTYSQIVYQEQIMRIVQELGGFTLVEADNIRKAMGKKLLDVMVKYKEQFIAGAIERGCPEDEAARLWQDMEGFAGYAFNRCISGEERIYRASQNKTGKSIYWPTIEEMYKIYNDLEYAKSVNKHSLRKKYRRLGYPHSFSLNKEGRLVKNKIKDIRLVGEKDLYKVTTQSGKTIRVTMNHKFPTSNGEKKLEDIDLEQDLLFINAGFIQYDSSHRFGIEENHNYPTEGQQGFQSKDTDYTRWRSLKEKEVNVCEKCSKENCRIEMHHKDGDHSHNVEGNVTFLCVSCHKKAEYALGRQKMGEAGLHTVLEKIVSIEFYKKDTVYDVEMEHPYHTFTVESGIVTSNSHATCYGITGYYSQWLKYKYPLEFWLISLKYSDDKKMPARISEIHHIAEGISMEGPNVLKSKADFVGDVESSTIYWSLSSIKQVGVAALQEVEKLRSEHFFANFEDFLHTVDREKEIRRQNLKPGERMTSTINRRVINHMIIAGAFDRLDGIEYPSQRWNLMVQHFSHLHPELKADPLRLDEKNWIKRMGNFYAFKDFEDHAWTLKQKELCGFGTVKFEELLQSLSFKNRGYYKPNGEVLEIENNGERAIVGGIVEEIKQRPSKNGPFVTIMLQDGFNPLYVTIWNEVYSKYKEEIDESKGKLLFIEGEIVFDGYKQAHVIHSKSYSTVEILK